MKRMFEIHLCPRDTLNDRRDDVRANSDGQCGESKIDATRSITEEEESSKAECLFILIYCYYCNRNGPNSGCKCSNLVIQFSVTLRDVTISNMAAAIFG